MQIEEDDRRRRELLRNLDDRNAAMLRRVKTSGITVRPKHVDKLSAPRGVFNRGRKQTI